VYNSNSGLVIVSMVIYDTVDSLCQVSVVCLKFCEECEIQSEIICLVCGHLYDNVL
jgi:hypothetical protein